MDTSIEAEDGPLLDETEAVGASPTSWERFKKSVKEGMESVKERGISRCCFQRPPNNTILNLPMEGDNGLTQTEINDIMNSDDEGWKQVDAPHGAYWYHTTYPDLVSYVRPPAYRGEAREEAREAARKESERAGNSPISVKGAPNSVGLQGWGNTMNVYKNKSQEASGYRKVSKNRRKVSNKTKRHRGTGRLRKSKSKFKSFK